MKYVYKTKLDDTNGWVEIHDLLRGWGWLYVKDGIDYNLYISQIEISDFNKLSHEEKITLSVKLQKEEQDRLSKIKHKPVKDFSKNFALPLIKQKFPELFADKIKNSIPLDK